MTGFHVDRRGFLIGTAAISAALAAGPRFAWADGKVLKVRSYSDLQVLDPAHRLSAPEDDITNFVLQMLIRWKNSTKWEWELGAAESIEQTDDTHISFKLRPGLQWSNGFGDVTAEDVK